MDLKNCCCCAPLRSGTLAIAILYLVINVLGLLGWSIFSITLYGVHNASNEVTHYQEADALTVVYILLGVVPLASLCIVANSMLIFGVRRNHRVYMVPWIVWYGVLTIILQALWVAGCGYLLHEMVTYRWSEGYGIYVASFIASCVPGVVTFVVIWYWYACVVSYYMLLAHSDHYVMEPLRVA